MDKKVEMEGKKIYFAPMEGITDGILRQVHAKLFGGIDIYGLPFHKLTQSVTLTTRETRDVSPSENAGLQVLPQALTRDPNQLLTWLQYIAELGYPCADLNIGCPSPTVTRRGRGSGMLRDTEYLRAFLMLYFPGNYRSYSLSKPVLATSARRSGRGFWMFWQIIRLLI